MTIVNSQGLNIVVPCFNEQDNLESTIKRIKDWCKLNNLEFQIIIVNNNSTDKTQEVAQRLVDENLLLVNEKKKGKGFAVKKGMMNSKYNNVLIIDADLSTDIDHLKVDWLNAYNSLIIGSRPLGIEIGTPFIRRTYGKVLNYLIRIIFPINIKDTQCGFKFLSTNKLNEVINEIEFGGFIYDLDLIMVCRKLKFKIIETPVSYNFDENSSVSLIRDPILVIKDLVRLKKKFKN
ncbi:MAG: hypothetical protein CBD76_00230 [Pelagibacteraceae bacterium TMED216]|nr:MAG: hypothetical protein CBD76_00230 [Pelagibacteraceae bacterium TMED216]